MDALRTARLSRFAAPPRQPQPWSALGLIALYFLLQLSVGGLLALSLGAAMDVLRKLRHQLPGVDVTTSGLIAQPDVQIALIVLTVGCSALIVLSIARRCWPAMWALAQPPGFGFVPASAAFYLVAAAIGLGLPVVGSLLTQLLAHGQDVPQDVRQLGGNASLGPRIVLLLAVVSLGPLVEELLFRGVLLSALREHLPASWAVATSAALFALVHLPDLGLKWYALPNLALLGVALAWLRLRSGSIWPAVAAHGLNNLLAALAWFLVSKP